jgi:hypothetical protein
MPFKIYHRHFSNTTFAQAIDIPNLNIYALKHTLDIVLHNVSLHLCKLFDLNEIRATMIELIKREEWKRQETHSSQS